MAQSIGFRIEASNLDTMFAALDRLGEKKFTRTMRWALGKAGDRGYTASKRAIAKELGLKQAVVAGQMKKGQRALEFIVDSKGARLPLKYYTPRQTKKGVTVRIYGRRRLERSAFIIRRFDGNVYRRTSKARFPIVKLTGPAIPVEMVREKSVDAFREALARVFPAELERLVARG